MVAPHAPRSPRCGFSLLTLPLSSSIVQFTTAFVGPHSTPAHLDPPRPHWCIYPSPYHRQRSRNPLVFTRFCRPSGPYAGNLTSRSHHKLTPLLLGSLTTRVILPHWGAGLGACTSSQHLYHDTTIILCLSPRVALIGPPLLHSPFHDSLAVSLLRLCRSLRCFSRTTSWLVGQSGVVQSSLHCSAFMVGRFCTPD